LELETKGTGIAFGVIERACRPENSFIPMNDFAASVPGSLCRLLIVEDYPILAELLANQLTVMAEYEVVGVASTAEAAVELLSSARPDVILLDLGLPARADGMQVLREARRLLPQTKILVFSASGAMANVYQCVMAGVDGFVEKTAPWEELLAALRRVRSGQHYLGTQVAEKLLDAIRRDSDGRSLSEREVDVMIRLSEGAVVKEIAEELGVGTPMVYRLLIDLRSKLHAESNEDLLRRAYALGYLEPPGPHLALPGRGSGGAAEPGRGASA
jgi:DNA-binding NarL/FixJ family response regulator